MADERPCFICDGTGSEDVYGEDDETVVGKEDCYLCKGTGKIDEGCYCHARCSCECICGAWGNEPCLCWEY